MLNISIGISRETVKALEETLRQAYRAGDAKLVKRVTALLGISRHESARWMAVELGCSVASIYLWLKRLLYEGPGGLKVRWQGGRHSKFIDDVAGCGVHGFVMEPATDMGYIAEKYGKTHAFIGNADTRILLSGTRDQIRTEVERCMAIGKACPGFFMAVGNHIPSNTPIENALYYNEVYDELSRR